MLLELEVPYVSRSVSTSVGGSCVCCWFIGVVIDGGINVVFASLFVIALPFGSGRSRYELISSCWNEDRSVSLEKRWYLSAQ